MDLRCWAVRPAVPLTVAKQREQCLAVAHLACATYQATLTADDGLGAAKAPAARGERAPGDEAQLWPPTRQVPLALEPVRAMGRLRVPDAIGGQVLLVGLMTAALVIFVIARMGSTAAPGASAVPTLPPVATPAGSVAPTDLAPTPTPEITPIVTPEPTTAPTPEPTPETTPPATATPGPSAAPTPKPSFRTYVVAKSDTLWSISVKFGVTVKAILKANHMTSTVIHSGQVLIIP